MFVWIGGWTGGIEAASPSSSFDTLPLSASSSASLRFRFFPAFNLTSPSLPPSMTTVDAIVSSIDTSSCSSSFRSTSSTSPLTTLTALALGGDFDFDFPTPALSRSDPTAPFDVVPCFNPSKASPSPSPASCSRTPFGFSPSPSPSTSIADRGDEAFAACRLSSSTASSWSSSGMSWSSSTWCSDAERSVLVVEPSFRSLALLSFSSASSLRFLVLVLVPPLLPGPPAPPLLPLPLRLAASFPPKAPKLPPAELAKAPSAVASAGPPAGSRIFLGLPGLRLAFGSSGAGELEAEERPDDWASESRSGSASPERERDGGE
ncbi:hypothetical protein BT69DRAFT_1279112 [Atractiella rhizophila]|nr:hypothetical protein BT69DRAFT_1279112 [Atractiella rhizophila]